MTPLRHNELTAEPLIHAAEAAHLLNVPQYWLSQPEERERRRIPHYRVGKLLRFRLSELMAWACACAGSPHA